MVSPIAFAALWYGVHHTPWLGAHLADAIRSGAGDKAVGRLEEVLYAFEDRIHHLTRHAEKPKSYWDVPPPALVAPPSADAGAAGPPPFFRPAYVGPLLPEVAVPGDGVWVPVEVPEHPTDPPMLYKTLVHPDPRRPWAELFVVAFDVHRLRLFAVAGKDEPKAETAEGRAYVRTGLVPEAARGELVAVVNGGFKAEHGHLGMRVDGVTLLPPRDPLCTIAAYSDGSLRIGSWAVLASSEGDMLWWRQTPACMVEHGTLHGGLADEANMYWGAAISGDTVVRRSAMGLDRDGTVLYVGLSNHTTARAIAVGMQHVGATVVAQLDVNWSYPRFVMFRRTSEGTREGFSLFHGFAVEKDEYFSRPSTRDYFYVLRRADEGRPGPVIQPSM